MSAEQTGVINLGSKKNFLLHNNIPFSGAQRIINQHERRSLFKVKKPNVPCDYWCSYSNYTAPGIEPGTIRSSV